MMAATVAILKFFKRHLLPNYNSVWAQTWWEESEWHRDSELLKSFRSDIQYGHILKFFKQHLLPNLVGLSQNLMGSIPVTQRFRIAKTVAFRYPSWLPWLPSWNSSNDLLQDRKSDCAKNWWEALQWHRDSELLKSFCSDIQDGCHRGHLEILQNGISSQTMSDWAETWGESLEHYRDLELPKSLHSDIQDFCHLEILQTTSPKP